MLSNRTIKFLAVSMLIVIAVIATVSMVAPSANENTLNSSQNTALAGDFESGNGSPLRQPDPFDALTHPGPGR
jgi:hypothetical protein